MLVGATEVLDDPEPSSNSLSANSRLTLGSFCSRQQHLRTLVGKMESRLLKHSPQHTQVMTVVLDFNTDMALMWE